MNRDFGFNTRALHAGQQPDPHTGARAVPIYQTTSYVFEDVDHAANLFALQRFGNIYTRIMNPTVAALEERMASLEGGVGALAASSGHAAQAMTMLTLMGQGDHIVSSRSLYGGTHTQFEITLPRLGIDTTFVDIHNLDEVAAAITPRTRALYAETIGNPLADVPDLEALADVAHSAGIPFIVDNTFATPYLCRPLEWGADLVVQSITKFVGGHGTSIGGMVVDGGRFPWDNGHFPGMTEPSAGYHGVRFYETFGEWAWIMKARVETLRDYGMSISPFNAFLFLQGIETLSLRMDRHVANAQKVAEFLHAHSLVEWVSYPGLRDSPYHERATRYLPRGAGAVFTFGIRGGIPVARRFVEALQLFSHLANVGDAKSLIIHPASTTHAQLSSEEREAAGVSDDMLRISIGLEDADDLLWDLDQALTTAGG